MTKVLWLIALLIGAVAPSASFAQSTSDYQRLFQGFRASELSRTDKRFLQTALAFEGEYNGLLDGDWGPISQDALGRYAYREFGTGAEEWHMAFLAAMFLEERDKNGWAIRYIEPLGMSMLFPYRANVTEPSSEYFVNWRHTNSSLGYSTGILSSREAANVHDYALAQHDQRYELYTLRRSNLNITAITESDGTKLYARSNYIDGLWSTILLSASRYDADILNAVASSLNVGNAPDITIATNGKLETALVSLAAFLAEEDSPSEPVTSPAPAEHERGLSSGTGLIVSDEGHVLTNAHVVARCESISIDGLQAELVAESETFDLALLKADQIGSDQIASFSPAPARLNSDVTVVGFPLAGILSGLNVTRGAVSSQMGLSGEATQMQITAPVQPGNSGGPVLAMDGEVVGVVVSKLNAQGVADMTGDIPQNVNFAIRGEIAKLFLFQNGVEPQLGVNDDRLDPVDLAELAEGFTVFVECM